MLHERNQIGVPMHAAALGYLVNLKARPILSFVQLIEMSQFHPLSGNNERFCFKISH